MKANRIKVIASDALKYLWVIVCVVIFMGSNALFADTVNEQNSQTQTSVKKESSLKNPDAKEESKKDEEEESPWDGSIQAGGVVNTGNSDNTNIHAKATLDYENETWDNLASLEGQQSFDKKGTAAQNVKLNTEARYLFDKKNYVFGNFRFGYDKFGTFDLVFKEVLGAGRVLYKSKKTSVSLEMGPGVSHSRIAGPKTYQNELIISANAIYKYKLSKKSYIKQTVRVDIGRLNINTKAISLLKTSMTEHLALELSLMIEHDSTIPKGSSNTKHTDTISKISVVYDF